MSATLKRVPISRLRSATRQAANWPTAAGAEITALLEKLDEEKK